MTPVAGDALSAVSTTNIMSTYDVFKPQQRRDAIQKYGGQGADYMQIIYDMGNIENVAGEKVEHWEILPYYQLVKVKANAAAAAGADLTFLLHADSSPTIPGTNPFVRKGDVLMKTKDETVGVVISDPTFAAGDWTVVVRPNDSADSLAVLANDTFAIISGAWGEMTGQPAPAQTGVVKYDAYLQIIKETSAASGSLITNQLWFQTMEKIGDSATYWSPLVAQLEYRLNIKQEGAYLFNKATTNASLGIANTNGLIPTMRSARGYQYPTGGAIVLSDVDDWNERLNKVFAGNRVYGLTTHKRVTELETELKDDMKNTMVEMANKSILQAIKSNGALQDSQESFSINYNFNAVRKGGRDFAWSRLASLDNPNTYNAPGSSQQNYMLMFPIDKARDAKNTMRNHISILKKNFDGYNRFMELWYDGAAGTQTKIGQMDAKYLYARSHTGTRHFALEQTILVTA